MSLEDGAFRITNALSSFFRRHRRKLLAALLWLVLLGSSVAMDLDTGAMSLDLRFLLASAAMFTASIGVSRIKQSERKKEDDDSQTDA